MWIAYLTTTIGYKSRVPKPFPRLARRDGGIDMGWDEVSCATCYGTRRVRH